MFKLTARAAAAPDRSCWTCLNARCGEVFSDLLPNPPCPRCGCVRVSWSPPSVAIRHATTTHNDKTLKSVANSFGLTNLGQRGGTHEGERAEPNLPTPKTYSDRMYEPMPGFKVPWSNSPTAGFGDQAFALGAAKVGARFMKGKNSRIPTQVVAASDK